MAVEEQLIARISVLETAVEDLQSQEVRRFITDYDWLRGIQDDFLGRTLDPKYLQIVMGPSSTIVLVNALGGVVRIRGGAGAGRFSLLELGDGAGGYEPLKADNGWAQIGYFRLTSIADVYSGLYSYNFLGSEIVFTGIRTDVVANNWMIRANDGVAFAQTDTGVVADTDRHWHVQEVYPTSTGHQIDYTLDGDLIGSQTARIPIVNLTPGLLSYTLAGVANKNMHADFWATVPRN